MGPYIASVEVELLTAAAASTREALVGIELDGGVRRGRDQGDEDDEERRRG